jgi:hypothetical protein
VHEFWRLAALPGARPYKRMMDEGGRVNRKRVFSIIRDKAKTSPDRAGSYRNCRRELRLPIPNLALFPRLVFMLHPSALLLDPAWEPAHASARAGSWARNRAQLSMRAPCAA